MLSIFFFELFVAFPDRKDALLSTSLNSVNVDASGSLGLYYGGKCHQTFPNETLTNNEEFDWCSNIGEDNSEEKKPWLMYNIKNKKMILKNFAVRNGCCMHACCCTDDNKVFDYACCCVLYSFSLQASNDNKTWNTLHKVEKISDFWECKFITFDISEEKQREQHNVGGYAFVRIVLDEQYPNCKRCMQINQVELYGETVDGNELYKIDDDNDESVSIIGKVRKTVE